ncbi:hypothetical protein SAV31267_009850 [Streptomyces avermitilis]|uniref:PKS/mFAS DH domain-containing protein n=1 Tax=Streptomyces avermitilis TaxID=33903 RepID=A0A4D4MHL6_STRAX|nr:hypothetical protein SAV31267_009850 [Streptomyces avermitilis]
MVWGRAIELPEGELALYTAFRPGADELTFEVYSEAGEGRVTHVRGSVVAAAGPNLAPVDLDGLRDRLTPVRDRAAAYADYQAAGFGYGPSFQVVDEIRSGPREALLRLSGDGSQTAAEVPPALLDGALRACHWAGRTAAPGPANWPSPSASARSRCSARCPPSATCTPGSSARRPESAAST